MLAKSVIYDGQLQRQVQQGDVAAAGEILAALTTAGAGTLTGAVLVNSILQRSGPVAAFTDTTDTAAAIIAAAGGQYASAGIQVGTSWRLKYQNNVAFDGTLAAGTGVTLAGTNTIPGLSIAELLIQVKNGTPTSVVPATVDGAGAVITGMTAAQTALITAGMGVSGTGIPASSTVLSVQPGVGVTISNNTTVAGTLVALTFVPQVTITLLNSSPIIALQENKQVTSATTGTTYIAGDMTGAKNVVLTSSGNGANAMTTRTAAQLIADQGNVAIGSSWRVRINQTGNNTLTLTGGVGVTISGTATVATTVMREYILTVTGAATITMTNVGALAA